MTSIEAADYPIVPSLPKLLKALAAGVTTVNALPVSSDQNVSYDSDDDSDGDDEFSYLMALPEFSSICLEAQKMLVNLLKQTIHASVDTDSRALDISNLATLEEFDFHQPILWDVAAEVTEVLLDRVDQFIASVRDERSTDNKLVSIIKKAGDTARLNAKGRWKDLLGALVDMEKPQTFYKFDDTVNNSRTEPFIPKLHPSQPWKHIHLSTLRYSEGHGLETRSGSAKNKPVPDDVIAPLIHYLHPYQDELKSLQCSELDCSVPFDKDMIPVYGLGGTLFNNSMSIVHGIWIDQESDLILLVDRITKEEVREIAVDLEAHSYRSFSGFVCLMQISLRRPTLSSLSSPLIPEKENTIFTAYDFLIDTLRLRKVINNHLAPIFADPNILKVMHGANSDILWLQRDFGLYVLNLFDTGIATRFLPHLGSCGLAKILHTFAGVQADKKHQLSDWRQRPLPNEMRQYAVSDTMYLLDLYDRLKLELTMHNERKDIVRMVFEESKKICLQRYHKEPFYPSGYKVLMNWRMPSKDSSITDSVKENILKALFDWRDRVARTMDESLQYICSDYILVRISNNCPRTVTEMQTIVNQISPPLLSCTDEVLKIIQMAINPQIFPVDITRSNSTGKVEQILPESQSYINNKIINDEYQYSDVDEDDTMLESSSIEVHSSNTDFNASIFSLQRNGMMQLHTSNNRAASATEKVVDGIGDMHSAATDSFPKSLSGGIKKEYDTPLENAADIHQKVMEKYSESFRATLPSDLSDCNHQNYDCDDSDDSIIHDQSDRDNSLPRSLREIYRISNQNRVRSRDDATLSKFNLGDNQEVESYAVDTIDGANQVISTSGISGRDYFEILNDSKRQKATDSSNTTEDINIHFMKDIGWLTHEDDIKQVTLDSLSAKIPSTCSRTAIVADNKFSVNRKGKQDIPAQRRPNNPGIAPANRISDSIPMSLFDSKEPPDTNPYYVGAAISGATDTFMLRNDTKRKDMKPYKAPRQYSSVDRHATNGSGNKSFVYRK